MHVCVVGGLFRISLFLQAQVGRAVLWEEDSFGAEGHSLGIFPQRRQEGPPGGLPDSG